jgi:hypothetical protein
MKRIKHPMELFIMKLILMGKIEAIEFHRQMGRYYGYPWCCINNYIRVLYSGQAPAKYMHDTFGHRHGLRLVLCNECHTIYQQYVGSNQESVFIDKEGRVCH